MSGQPNQSEDPEEIRLVRSGADYFDTLEKMITGTKEILHFQMYIFDEDETGKRILKALKEAAGRGVKIFMLLDAFGSNNFSEKTATELKELGIVFKWFAPFFSRHTLHLGRRAHHKVIVADHFTTLIGGINVSDKYRGNDKTLAWLDYAILVKGTLSDDAEKLCNQIMNKEFDYHLLLPGKTNSIDKASLRINDRLRGKNEISRSYRREMKKAKSSITLLTSYFLPGTRIRFLLKRAARRGVNVKIILTGIADVPLLGMAARYLYGSLLKNNIEIYEWNKSVLHGKLALIDRSWATVGSFNLNHLSALSSIEVNVDVREQKFIEYLELHLEEIIRTGCSKIDRKEFNANRTLLSKIKDAIAYFVSRAAMRFLGLFPNLFPFSDKGKSDF